MEIIESVTIFSEMDHVWDIFTDLACWNEWNHSMTEAARPEGNYFISEGQRLSLKIRLYALPFSIKPLVECVVPHDQVVWSARKFGVFAKHEFLFTNLGGAVQIVSREKFAGLRPFLMMLPKARIRKVTASMLRELKKKAESRLPTS
jgi:hypothetical protein